MAWAFNACIVFTIISPCSGSRCFLKDHGKPNVILVQATPLQAWLGPECSRRLRFHRFQDNWQMKVVRLSALRTGCLYPTGNINGNHFCQQLSQIPGSQCSWKDCINESNPRPSGLQCSASTNCTTACSITLVIEKNSSSGTEEFSRERGQKLFIYRKPHGFQYRCQFLHIKLEFLTMQLRVILTGEPNLTSLLIILFPSPYYFCQSMGDQGMMSLSQAPCCA